MSEEKEKPQLDKLMLVAILLKKQQYDEGNKNHGSGFNKVCRFTS